jgi:hypothetical protein
VKHFKVKGVAGLLEFGERTFESLAELIDFYGQYSIYTTAAGEGICLKHPMIAG